MAGALRKTMVYLGLAEDDDRYEGYDDYDVEADRHEDEREERRPAEVTPLPQRTPVARVVRDHDGAGLTRITTIHPRTYYDAKGIGESFRDGVPVIMNLTDMQDAEAKRVVDFAAGLTFGLQGQMERVTAKVFLLSPAHIEVSGTEEGSEPARLFSQS